MRIRDSGSLLERMDRLVLWSGIPRVLENRLRRRHLRWLPLVMMTFATVGLLTILLRPSSYWVGYAMLMVAYFIGNFVPMVGPVVPLLANEDVDERERTSRRNALLVGFGTISAVAFVGLFVLIALTVLQNWPLHTLLRAMMALAFYFLVIYATVPTLYASWATSLPLDEDD